MSRLTCAITTPARLDGTARVSVTNGYLGDRVGWREMTATGDGVGLVNSSLPERSVSDELRGYPQDLLASALNVRSATLDVKPGPGTRTTALTARPNGSDPVAR